MGLELRKTASDAAGHQGGGHLPWLPQEPRPAPHPREADQRRNVHVQVMWPRQVLARPLGAEAEACRPQGTRGQLESRSILGAIAGPSMALHQRVHAGPVPAPSAPRLPCPSTSASPSFLPPTLDHGSSAGLWPSARHGVCNLLATSAWEGDKDISPGQGAWLPRGPAAAVSTESWQRQLGKAKVAGRVQRGPPTARRLGGLPVAGETSSWGHPQGHAGLLPVSAQPSAQKPSLPALESRPLCPQGNALGMTQACLPPGVSTSPDPGLLEHVDP